MSIFGSIKNAIFGHDAAAAAPAAEAQPTAPEPVQPVPAATGPAATPTHAAAAEPMDVDAMLTKLADTEGETELNWQTSIVDLMKLTGMDASVANREELATELEYTGEKGGSAQMNEWLHTAVMNKLRNG